MGFSCDDDTTDTEEYSIQLAEEIEEETQNVSSAVMDAHQNQVDDIDMDMDMEFWPLEHPMEPPDEDHPLKYPMPDSAAAINGGQMHERRLGGESIMCRRKPDASLEMNKKGKFLRDPDDPAAADAHRAVRKRHHTTLTHGDIIITPLRTLPHPREEKNSGVTIFQMLQQLDTFEP